MNINDVPTEVIDHIFTFLPWKNQIKVELVSKRWRDIVKNLQKRTTSLALHDSSQKVNEYLPQILNRYDQSLKHLHIQSQTFSGQNPISLSPLTTHCSHLESLSFSRVVINNKLSRESSISCVRLKKLVMTDCFLAESIWPFFQNCSELELLDLSGTKTDFGECFRSIHPSLKTLVLNRCLLYVSDITQMKHLTCIHTLILNDGNWLDDSVLKSILENLTHTLKTLHLESTFPKVKSLEPANVDYLRPVISLMTDVEDLSLAHNYKRVNDDVICLIVEYCKSLKKLNLAHTSVGNEGIYQLRKLGHLQELDASFILYGVCDGLHWLVTEKRLATLKINRLHTEFYYNVNETEFLSKHCKHFILM